jgi:hypothetical protein
MGIWCGQRRAQGKSARSVDGFVLRSCEVDACRTSGGSGALAGWASCRLERQGLRPAWGSDIGA